MESRATTFFGNSTLVALIVTLATTLISFTTLSLLYATELDYSSLSLGDIAASLTSSHPGKSGAYVFEKGEESLMARAWLTDHAVSSIEVQYFIWSTDNIGILAAEALLRAAERGVKVRVVVDDLLIDAPDKSMIALNDHPNIQIRIYNPKHSVGTSTLQRLVNLTLQFRSVNQRMHDKTFTVDSEVSITGGRNMADEYFDYDHSYNFRDRDILLLGPVVDSVGDNFETFWRSPFVTPVEQLLPAVLPVVSPQDREKVYRELHEYGSSPGNFSSQARHYLQNLHHRFDDLEKNLNWGDIDFIHDIPGKNHSTSLSGGSETTQALIEALSGARESVLIQSPYLIMPEGGIEFFKKLVDRGVRVKISTNSLASTDNLQAFSGYAKQRREILETGIEVYEYKPDPAVQKELIERYEDLQKEVPTFAIHAKSMVIDHELLFVGTFNLDPRSAHLNTEVGILVRNRPLAARVEESIHLDIRPENSWNAATDQPDREAPFGKRVKVWFWRLLPLSPIL